MRIFSQKNLSLILTLCFFPAFLLKKILKPDLPQWINLQAPNRESVTMIKAHLSEEGIIEGDIQSCYKGYAAVDAREEIEEHSNTPSTAVGATTDEGEEEKRGSFQMSSKLVGKNLLLNCTFKLNQTHSEPIDYPALKKFIDLVIDKQREQIVLHKKEVPTQ